MLLSSKLWEAAESLQDPVEPTGTARAAGEDLCEAKGGQNTEAAQVNLPFQRFPEGWSQVG